MNFSESQKTMKRIELDSTCRSYDVCGTRVKETTSTP